MRGAGRRLGLAHAVLRAAAPRAWFLEDELTALGDLVGPGARCVDVGAHVGLYALALAALAGPDGRVVAVEPQRGPRRVLRAQTALLGARTVAVSAAALGAVAGRGSLSVPLRRGLPVHGRAFLTAGAHGRGSNAEFRADRRVDVAVTTLDDLAAAHGLERVDLVKLDVEGAETAVLAGGARVLARDRPVLLVEVEDRHLGRYGLTATGVLASLGAGGYRAHVCERGRWVPVAAPRPGHRNYAFVAGAGPGRPA